MAQKVVVHFRDGRLLKGFAEQPSPNHPTQDVVPLDQQDQAMTVRLDTLKAVFFVKDFVGDSAYSEDKSPASGAPTPAASRSTWKTARISSASSKTISRIAQGSS
jgi:Family of unknown function (DUF6982)